MAYMEVYQKTRVMMDTHIQIGVISDNPKNKILEKIDHAFRWFLQVEAICSRFDPKSEIAQLSSQIKKPVQISQLLFQILQFALFVSELTEGAFDPTIGYLQEKRGFNRNFRTGELSGTRTGSEEKASYQDILLNTKTREVTILKPLKLDLGAIAKGAAIDLAAKELCEESNFFINAGGDVYVKGQNKEGNPWKIGVRHPKLNDKEIVVISFSEMALCVSGDYERRSPVDKGNHILDPRTGNYSFQLATTAILASTAMVADALSTAVFCLGVELGLELLENQQIEGLFVTQGLEQYETHQFKNYLV